MLGLIGLIRRITRIIKYPFYFLRKNQVPLSSQVGSGTFLRDSKVGNYCYIGRNCVINSAIVGNYTCIASGVQIGGMEHSICELSISPTLMGESNTPVGGGKCLLGVKTDIGYDVWIAANCIIKQGVKIGDGAVIGANSFVNKDVEPYSIVFGTPAKFYKYRKCKSIEHVIKESQYWDYKPEEAKKILEKIANF